MEKIALLDFFLFLKVSMAIKLEEGGGLQAIKARPLKKNRASLTQELYRHGVLPPDLLDKGQGHHDTCELQGDQLIMAVFFWYLGKSDASVVYCTVVYTG